MEKSNLTRLERFHGKTPEEIFNLIYEDREWTSEESISGFGSTLEHTKNSRVILPILFKKYEIRSVIDVACGDFNWIKSVTDNLEYYRGNDIVKKLIDSNTRKYGVKDKIEFEHGDIIENFNPIPEEYDAIIAKDVLVHFPTRDVIKVLENFRKSGIKYLFTTHFYEIDKNIDLSVHGQWRPINFSLEPFNLGEPLEIIRESSEIYKWVNMEGPIQKQDKSLALWKIN